MEVLNNIWMAISMPNVGLANFIVSIGIFLENFFFSISKGVSIYKSSKSPYYFIHDGAANLLSIFSLVNSLTIS